MTLAARTSPYTEQAFSGLDPERRQALIDDLLAWYARERRSLPWRASGDPYCIWVSEVMLQQTQVATVIGYYERWLEQFPTVAVLARANVDDVLRAWEGLGYYSRARNLWRAARELVLERGGRLPSNVEELRRLPGIGAYSAGAIASIAFGADEPAIDGNIVRVLTRLFGIAGDPRRPPVSLLLWRLARALLPPGRAGDFNQALMELGATCCTPKAPRCATCPVSARCIALREGRVDALPERARRPELTRERRAVAVIARRGRLLVAQLGEVAPRWAGMWQFPDAELTSSAETSTASAGPRERAALASAVSASTGLTICAEQQLTTFEHTVTRFRIQLDVFSCRVLAGRTRPSGYAALRWVPREELSRLAMPAAHRKIARSLS